MHPIRWAKSTGHGDRDIRWQDSRIDCTNSSHVGLRVKPFARRPRPTIQSPSRASRVQRSSPGRPSKSSASISRLTTRPQSIAGIRTSRSSNSAPLGSRRLFPSFPRVAPSRHTSACRGYLAEASTSIEAVDPSMPAHRPYRWIEIPAAERGYDGHFWAGLTRTDSVRHAHLPCSG